MNRMLSFQEPFVLIFIAPLLLLQSQAAELEYDDKLEKLPGTGYDCEVFHIPREVSFTNKNRILCLTFLRREHCDWYFQTQPGCKCCTRALDNSSVEATVYKLTGEKAN